MSWVCTKAARLRLGRSGQRGVYAVELALVFPLFLAFMCGIFVFSLAFMSRQLLGNVAAETARQCVTRSYLGQSAVDACTKPLGQWLVSRLPLICLGGPVVIGSQSQSSGVAGMAQTAGYPVNEMFLVVSASCTWTFVPGKQILGNGGALPMPDADIIKGMAAVPYTVYKGSN